MADRLRVAVAGASGFLGSHLVPLLQSREMAVSPIGRTAGALPPVDCLCNLAALIPSDMTDARAAAACRDVNVAYAAALTRRAIEAGARLIAHVSTGNAYQGGELDRPRRESDPQGAFGHGAAYLASKIEGELAVRAEAAAAGAALCIIRPSGLYGPGMRAGMLRAFVDRALAGQPIEVRGHGSYGSDLVHVADVAAALAKAIWLRRSGTYNLGSGVRTTALEAAQLVAAIFGATLRVTGGPAPEGFPALDISAARNDLGFAPRSLEAGLQAWRAALTDDRRFPDSSPSGAETEAP